MAIELEINIMNYSSIMTDKFYFQKDVKILKRNIDIN
nr:MAG TPA: hypothetical protein [Crassvirales sp.]